MSSYHAIHIELLKIDQMILQASASRLIKKIHHDLVERQCKLFERVAKLDADSMMLWRNESGFFQDVMKEIDLFDLDQITENTLYKRISELRKISKKAAAAIAAAIVSTAATKAAQAISDAISSGASSSSPESLSQPSSLTPSTGPSTVGNTSRNFQRGLPALRRSERKSVASSKKRLAQNLPSHPPLHPSQSRESPIVISDDSSDDDHLTIYRQPTETNTNKMQKKRPHRAVEDDEDDEEEEVAAMPKKEKALPKKKSYTTRPKKRRNYTEAEDGADSESNMYRTKKRHYVGSNQYYPQPCEFCASRNAPCEKPAEVGGSCMLCKLRTKRCIYALSPAERSKLMHQRAVKRNGDAMKKGKKA